MMGVVGPLLQRITAKRYAARTVEGDLENFLSAEWMEKGEGMTLVAMFYSGLGKGTLKIEKVCRGKSVSSFYMGNSSDVEKVWHSLASSLDMISRRS